MIELPSKIAFDSITRSSESISPFTCAPAFISTLDASMLPSTLPCTISLSAVILPFTKPFLPTFTSLLDLMIPSSSPSIYRLQDSSISPFIFAPAVIIVVFESFFVVSGVLSLLLKIAMVLFSPF